MALTSPRWAAVAAPLSLAAALLAFVFWRRRRSWWLQLDRGRKSPRPFYRVVEEEGSSKAELLHEEMAASATHIAAAHSLEQPVVIAMVGLPARGKSYVVKLLCRYLRWIGFEVQVFNVGAYRRRHLQLAGAQSNFFSSSNSQGMRIREEMAEAVQQELYDWFRDRGEGKHRIAIFDATNTTRDRRRMLARRARQEHAFLLFVESICTDEEILQRNYRLKLQNDDYKDMDPEVALSDFMARVKAYEAVYETIEDDEDDGGVAYIKLINVGQKVITRLCTGYLPSQIAFYLQNAHIQPRKIWLTLYAENRDHQNGILGSESATMTEAGRQYSLDLAKFVNSKQEELEGPGRDVLVLAGTHMVDAETVLHLKAHYPLYQTPVLNELRGGMFHGMNREEIKKLYPEEVAKREADKLNYRYPGTNGESYVDVIERVRPIIIELERQRRSVVMVCHLAVLRCIFAYFRGVATEELPRLQFDMHRVYELSPGPFGTEVHVHDPSEVQY